LKDSLVELAQRWAHLAIDLEFTQQLLAEWGDPGKLTGRRGA
jgi:hypothetical protein